MRNFQPKKNRLRRIVESPPFLVLLFAIVVLFSWSVFGFFEKMRETEAKRETAEEKVAELSEKKEKLTRDIEYLETDRGVEDNIREKFGFVKEGEKVIVIVEDENFSTQSIEEEKGSFWKFIRNIFK
ncbi:MAG TPA: septum formation initiator family protein [Candidatus Paceibacterota bacterium]|nr:septum formation initiator family protein [Candidatus Paceibacterota bacterium]